MLVNKNSLLSCFRNSLGLMMHILQGFCVPEVMLEKMRNQMSLLRTDKVKSRSVTPSSDQGKDRSIGSLFQDNDLNVSSLLCWIFHVKPAPQMREFCRSRARQK
jgi:hypothetical protein